MKAKKKRRSNRVASDDLLERDRMWCRAITATQKVDTTTGRMILDVADFLRHFNEVERSNAKVSGAGTASAGKQG
mgnify:CR=1 FL=1